MEAEEKLRQALTEAEESGSQDISRLAKSFHNLGVLRYDQGQYTDAESFYQASIATMEKEPGLHQRDLAGMFNNLALLYTKQGRRRRTTLFEVFGNGGRVSWPHKF